MSKVCWKIGDDWQVGEIAKLHFHLGDGLSADRAIRVENVIELEGFTVVKPWPTGEWLLVSTSLLRPYPFEEIPQP